MEERNNMEWGERGVLTRMICLYPIYLLAFGDVGRCCDDKEGRE